MTRTLVRPADEEIQRRAGDSVGLAWNCDVVTMPRFAVWDWVMVRDGALVGVGEFKRRLHEAGGYPTVFLALPKFRALTWASEHLDCPALFVVQFNDGIRWISVPDEVGGMTLTVGGRHDRPDVPTDIEELVEVPIARMHRLAAR